MSREILWKLLSRTLFSKSLCILMYHGITRSKLPVYDWCFITEKTFRRQLKYLRDHFHLTSLSSAVGQLLTGSVRAPTAVITFDDGFESTYELAYPALEESRTPATIFLPTKYVDSDETIWFCRLNHALTSTANLHLEWEGRVFKIDSYIRKAEVSRFLQEKLKELPHDQLTAAVDAISRTLRAENGHMRKTSPFRILNTTQISEMVLSGLIEFGAHTHSHSILNRLLPKKQEEEIAVSKKEVERLTNQPCRFFSYPNGRSQDYTGTTIHLLESQGFMAAVTTIPGSNGENSPLMELRRYDMGGGLHPASPEAAVHCLLRSGAKCLFDSQEPSHHPTVQVR